MTKLTTLKEYIERKLYSENFGFYEKKKPFGKSGSFVTSPHISSIFGEMIGLFLISNIKLKFKNSSVINLIEIGSGDGNLICDIMNIFLKFKNLFDKVNFISIEKSGYNLNQQIELLGVSVKYLKNINELELDDGICIFLSNELLDSYAVDQFSYLNSRWLKSFIRDKNIHLSELESDSERELIEFYIKNGIKKEIRNGDKIETCWDSINDFRKICKFINKNNGIVIFFDYGYTEWNGISTLQAVRNHKKVNLFEDGNVDITHLVNFELYKEIARNEIINIEDLFIQEQGNFLKSIGIIERMEIGIKNAKNDDEIFKIKKSVERLISPSEMGALFKVLFFLRNH